MILVMAALAMAPVGQQLARERGATAAAQVEQEPAVAAAGDKGGRDLRSRTSDYPYVCTNTLERDCLELLVLILGALMTQRSS